MNQRVPPESEPASNSATPTEIRPNQRDLRGRVIHGTNSEHRMLGLRGSHPNSAEALLGLVQRYRPEWFQPVSVKQTGEVSETSDPETPQAKDPPG